ncbi:hypothetical protein M501DRAFT_985259 [Patellaria atrata CBS 101060]|uniref:Uncharacterized protein n=1 Tax=Patellaria atrata CBS 101060 TaxID=1346257 RepID=A0A9P4VRM9_9PEZI|nr:hypothetical protein M501DRAFT_985259 [Patellaria atrata CBS 101060]
MWQPTIKETQISSVLEAAVEQDGGYQQFSKLTELKIRSFPFDKHCYTLSSTVFWLPQIRKVHVEDYRIGLYSGIPDRTLCQLTHITLRDASLSVTDLSLIFECCTGLTHVHFSDENTRPMPNMFPAPIASRFTLEECYVRVPYWYMGRDTDLRLFRNLQVVDLNSVFFLGGPTRTLNGFCVPPSSLHKIKIQLSLSFEYPESTDGRQLWKNLESSLATRRVVGTIDAPVRNLILRETNFGIC